MNDVAIRQERTRTPVANIIPVLDTAQFDHMTRVAQVMARMTLIPESLYMTGSKEKREMLPYDTVVANCFLVVNFAVRAGLDPFAVAQCVSVVRGKLCFEGKLVAAILDAKLGIKLDYTWDEKTGDSFGVVVTGILPDGRSRTVSGTVGDWKTGADGAWGATKAHRRMLAYRGAREWARMWAPALLLGVYTDDEMEDMQEASRANNARPVAPPAPLAQVADAGTEQPAKRRRRSIEERTVEHDNLREVPAEEAAKSHTKATVTIENNDPNVRVSLDATTGEVTITEAAKAEARVGKEPTTDKRVENHKNSSAAASAALPARDEDTPSASELLSALARELSTAKNAEDVEMIYNELDVDATMADVDSDSVAIARAMKAKRIAELSPKPAVIVTSGPLTANNVAAEPVHWGINLQAYAAHLRMMCDAAKTPEDIAKIRHWWGEEARQKREDFGPPMHAPEGTISRSAMMAWINEAKARVAGGAAA